MSFLYFYGEFIYLCLLLTPPSQSLFWFSGFKTDNRYRSLLFLRTTVMFFKMRIFSIIRLCPTNLGLTDYKHLE